MNTHAAQKVKNESLELVMGLVTPACTTYSRQEVDHGTRAFYCRPCSNMVGDRVTVMCDHGVLLVHDHGTLPAMITYKLSFCVKSEEE